MRAPDVAATIRTARVHAPRWRAPPASPRRGSAKWRRRADFRWPARVPSARVRVAPAQTMYARVHRSRRLAPARTRATRFARQENTHAARLPARARVRGEKQARPAQRTRPAPRLRRAPAPRADAAAHAARRRCVDRTRGGRSRAETSTANRACHREDRSWRRVAASIVFVPVGHTIL